ncbi:MAG: N-6 DNA methylase [Armatimonadota bacterium]|nr:N-6 DNA methylase [Armatimonadota bacterium]
MPRRPQDTEVHAYDFIKGNLRTLGWDVRNPERADSGQVWTQNECLSNPEIKSCLVLDRPENIVKVSEHLLWVIEAKRSHGQLAQAVKEAEDYADRFKASPAFRAVFVSGVAGNDIDSFLVRSRYFNGKQFVPVTLNTVDATALLSPAQVQSILRNNNGEITDPEIDESLFVAKAEHINEILHLGAVNPHQRAGVMAALLLSMLGSTPPNIEERDPSTLIGDINTRAEGILRSQGKANFFDHVRINLPSTPDNHVKLRKALVDTLQELNNLNIRSAMNSGVDWLGAFYEVFLKYANWAQDLGIVLTPRHVTRFIADVMDIRPHDIIYDPTCGTGGFLVAGLDYVSQIGSKEQREEFKKHSVFGIEQDAGIAALAVVNMIFRGDGKNNIKEGNCFANYLGPYTNNGTRSARFGPAQSPNPPITKVMMNPPFALKRSDEKEFKFIDQALAQLGHGETLFAVLPTACMVKPGIYLQWRRDVLLAGHTLLAVVTFPLDLFYPVAVGTVGVFVRKGVPHTRAQNVLWIRAVNDGLLKRKGKRLPNSRASNDLTKVRDVLKAFIQNPAYAVPNVPRLQKACPIDFGDRLLELVPESYLDQPVPTEAELREGIEQIVRDAVAFQIKSRREGP